MHSLVRTCTDPTPPACCSAHEIERDSCTGGGVSIVFFSLCHPPLGWSAAGAAVRGVRGHTVVLFWGKGLLRCQVAVVAGDSSAFMFPPGVTASAASPTPPPAGLQPQARPNGPHPDCNPCWSCMCVRVGVCWCVFAGGFGSVRRPRPMALASTDVTGSEECEECGGASAGVAVLGPGQKGAGQLGIGRQLHSPGRLPAWLVGDGEPCEPAEDGLRYFYGNCSNYAFGDTDSWICSVECVLIQADPVFVNLCLQAEKSFGDYL